MEESILTVLYSLVSLIYPLFVFITCCYYFFKRSRIDSILLFAGSGIALLVSGFYNVVMPYLLQVNYLSVSSVQTCYSITGVISFFSGMCFAVGLLILIINTLKNKSEIKPNFPPENGYT